MYCGEVVHEVGIGILLWITKDPTGGSYKDLEKSDYLKKLFTPSYFTLCVAKDKNNDHDA